MNRTVFSFSVSVALLGLLFTAAACASSPKAPEAVNDDGTVVSHTPPFQTKEPDRYRATRTITTVSSTGETVVTISRTARDGELRRDEIEIAGHRVVTLNLREGRFVLLPNEKLFALSEADQLDLGAEEDSESSPDRLLHTDQTAATYQRLGPETIGARSTQKYRVVVNSSPGPNVSLSETMVWIDEALQMPIKSEVKTTAGSRSTSELSEIALDVDQSFFRIPEGYEKITFAELRKRLQ